MRSKRGVRRRYPAALLVVGVVAASCTSGGDQSAEETATTQVAQSTASVGEEVTAAFTNWYNAVTSGDATAPICDEAAPLWVADVPLLLAASGPVLACADRTSNDDLVLRIVNNASGPLTIDYPDAAAAWTLASDDPDGAVVLAGGTGALIRPGASATLTASVGTWDEQDLALVFAERWAIVEATSEVMVALELESTFGWAADLADSCDVDAVAAADLGGSLEAGLYDFFGCVFDALGDAADDDDRTALTDVVPMVAQLVERSRNVASHQRAGDVPRSFAVVSQLPDPAGPNIESPLTTPPTSLPSTTAPSTTTRSTTTRSNAAPSTAPTSTRPPSTAVPSTLAPAPPSSATTVPQKVPTTQESPGLTVPLPPAPVLVALETIGAGVDTYTSWPAIDPKLGRLSGGQIVVIECKAFTTATTPGGNGWWYRIGSGGSAGGWASATGFENLVVGVAPGSTSADNVSDAVSNC